jgi:predicted ATPase
VLGPLGERQAALEQMREELRVPAAVLLFRPFMLGLYAEECGTSGALADGLDGVSEAFQLVETGGERWWLADLHRVRADLLLRQSAANRDEAERELRTALGIAREQGALILELRAAGALATLLAETRRRTEALELLRPAYSAITEGHGTADLVAARALLDALS